MITDTILTETLSFHQKKVGRFPNLGNPQLLTDKICWLKIYDQHMDQITCCDKVAVKAWVDARVPNITIPSTNGYPAVLKCTHDSGGFVFVNSVTEERTAIKKLEQLLKKPYGIGKGEWAYRFIPPAIIKEEKIDTGDVDYRFFCSNGKVKWLLMHIGQTGENRRGSMIDADGNVMSLRTNEAEDNLDQPPLCGIENFKKLKAVAEKLSEEWKFVRVDLYWDIKQDQVRFGELTFWPKSGHFINSKGSIKSDADLALGQMLDFDTSTTHTVDLTEIRIPKTKGLVVKVKDPEIEIIYPEINPDITVCTFATRGYMKHAAQLEQDCKKFGYKFHNYVLDIEDPEDIQEIYFQQPAHKLKAVKEFGRIIWLDAESRILKPFPDYWTDGTYQIIRASRDDTKNLGQANGGFLVIDKRNKKYLEDVCRACSKLTDTKRKILESYDPPLSIQDLRYPMHIGGTESILDTIFLSTAKFTDKTVFNENIAWDRFDSNGQTSKIIRGAWPSDNAVIAHPFQHRANSTRLGGSKGLYSASWVRAIIINHFIIPGYDEPKSKIIIDLISDTVGSKNREVSIIPFYINGKEHTYKQSRYRKRIWDQIAGLVSKPIVYSSKYDIYEFNNWYFSELHGWPKEKHTMDQYQEWLLSLNWYENFHREG